jgi:Avirulence protein
MSSYIVDRVPTNYGGQQQHYLEQTNKIVVETAEKFRKAVQEKEDLQAIFHQTLTKLGEMRNTIAKEHKTNDGDVFGVRRDSDNFRSICGITPLSFPYEEYNKKLLPVLQKHLGVMKHTCKEFQQKELSIQGKPCLGRASSMALSILPFEDMKKWAFLLTGEEVTRLCMLCSITPPEDSSQMQVLFDSMIINREAMSTLKQKSIEDYKRLKVCLAIADIKERYVGRKSDWVVVTIRSEVDGKMYALSQYLTWMNRDFFEDPVEHMTDRSIVTILHQDPFLIDLMLNDIAKIFKEAIGWNKENVTLLKNQIALLQYELAHAMPFIRGSAAISEWLEMAIYRFHGFTLTYNPDKMVNLEALTSLLDEFVQNYDSMISLTLPSV